MALCGSWPRVGADMGVLKEVKCYKCGENVGLSRTVTEPKTIVCFDCWLSESNRKELEQDSKN